MKNIPIIKYDLGQCEQINSPTGRRYKTPTGEEYPSVTTVLSVMPNPHLAAWKESVGEVLANEISSKAAANGTRLHESCELYLLGQEPKFTMFDFTAQDMFRLVKPVIDSVTCIHAVESMLWSDRLKIAGSVDLICEFDGELYIVDWKSSSRYKSASEISSYFMQCAAYALMFFERTGVAVKKIKIVMATKDDGLLVFNELVATWLPEFVKVRQQFTIERGV